MAPVRHPRINAPLFLLAPSSPKGAMMEVATPLAQLLHAKVLLARMVLALHALLSLDVPLKRLSWYVVDLFRVN